MSGKPTFQLSGRGDIFGAEQVAVTVPTSEQYQKTLKQTVCGFFRTGHGNGTCTFATARRRIVDYRHVGMVSGGAFRSCLNLSVKRKTIYSLGTESFRSLRSPNLS